MMEQVDFALEPGHDFVELNQLLKLVGVCESGGAGKALVSARQVQVDGAVELRRTCKVRAGQKVRVGGLEIRVLPAA